MDLRLALFCLSLLYQSSKWFISDDGVVDGSDAYVVVGVIDDYAVVNTTAVVVGGSVDDDDVDN